MSEKPLKTSAPPKLDPSPKADFAATVKSLHGKLKELDYFQLFKLNTTCNPKEIKEAYYRESRIYHPDRFAQLKDAELKNQINTIFKRVTEAYVVLRDDKKRAKYIVDISSPERDKKLRYTEASEAEQKAEEKKALEEQVGTTPKGRECFKNGAKDLEAKRFESAMRNFKTALMYEPANAKYKEKLKQAETEWDKVRPKNDFRIK